MTHLQQSDQDIYGDGRRTMCYNISNFNPPQPLFHTVLRYSPWTNNFPIDLDVRVLVKKTIDLLNDGNPIVLDDRVHRIVFCPKDDWVTVDR